jgi:hypothetical protein
MNHISILKKRSIVKRNQIYFSFPQYSSPSSEETLIDNEKINRDKNKSDNKSVENVEEVSLRRLTRISQPFTRLRDFISHKIKL